jgi:Papain family cysteine protease
MSGSRNTGSKDQIMTFKPLILTGLVLLSISQSGTAVLAQSGFMGDGTLAKSAPRHPTGLVRTPPDVLAKIPFAPTYRAYLPPSVDLSNYFPTIGDQAQQGACVAFSSGFAARAYYAEVVEHRDITKPENIPSPAFIYDAVHQPGTAADPCGGGSDPVDALTLLQDHGAASLADFPFDGRNEPSACPTLTDAQKAKGTDFRIASFERVQGLEDAKAELAQGNPIIVAADLDDGFMALHGPLGGSVWESGPIDPNAPYEGHAFTLIGYDDKLQQFKFLNSWGAEWGDSGFGRISYKAANNRIGGAFVMRMPGDPTITLLPADFRSDVPTPLAPMLKTGPNLGAATANGPVQAAGLWCGKVEVRKGADGKPVAAGFVGADTEFAKLKSQFGDDVDVSGVEIAPWPLCETRLTLGDSIGGDAAPVANITAAADGSRSVTLSTPADASFLYAVTFAVDGSVAAIGDMRPVGSVTGSKVQGTIGKDAQTLLVVASDKELMAAVPSDGSARAFLSALRDGILHGSAEHISAQLVTSLAK